MQSQYRALHSSASRGKNFETDEALDAAAKPVAVAKHIVCH